MATISYLEYSDRDHKYAKGVLTLGFYDPCGRFCQQSVEKRFKHFIELNGSPGDLKFLHTHNLGRLYDKVCELSGSVPNQEYRGWLSRLTDYYFDANYPKEINIELTEEMAIEALDITGKINIWVDSLNPPPDHVSPE